MRKAAGSKELMWPPLPLEAWIDTYQTLQLWTQVVGKIRMAATPWLNHSWQVVLYVTERGLSTSIIPYESSTFNIEFDFIDHVLWIRTSEGTFRQVMLHPQPVAEFYDSVMVALKELGINLQINEMPCELPDPIAFSQDTMHAAYDPDYANRFWRALLHVHRVFAKFRTSFLGKSSPVHFFWGSFDLAVTRFSGRAAPLLPNKGPLAAVMREAYSHQVSSAGFWPGDKTVGHAAFYSYAYPEPDGFRAFPVRPKVARYDTEAGQFRLPYDAVRTADEPEDALMEFLQSTYEAAAKLGKWDREALECEIGVPGKPRRV
jgi:hypothetical protein